MEETRQETGEGSPLFPMFLSPDWLYLCHAFAIIWTSMVEAYLSY